MEDYSTDITISVLHVPCIICCLSMHCSISCRVVSMPPFALLFQISIDNATSHVIHVSSKDRCTAADSLNQELHPLLFWNIPSIPVDMPPENLQYAFHLCISFHATTQSDRKMIRSASNQSHDYIDQSNGAAWSSPVWLPLKNTAVRKNVSVQHCDNDDDALSQTTLCTVMTQTEEGIVYIVLAKESSPPLLIHNNCPFPLHFGQELSTKTASEGKHSIGLPRLDIFVSSSSPQAFPII